MATPVFLHCGWRTAGTWLWSQLRDREGVTGFYEPLHESLASLTLRGMPAMRPAATDSRHPDSERPYFQEFAPLFSQRQAGVAGYLPQFAYEGFFAGADVEMAELRAYISSLIDFARSRETVAVFKFCRSLGRVGWMRRQFPDAAHIVVFREPWGQWLSAWRIFLEEGNPYFLTRPLDILATHGDDAIVPRVLRNLAVRPEAVRFPERHGPRCRAVRAAAPQTLYRAFLAFWIATAFCSLRESDAVAVIEADQLDVQPCRVRAETLLERAAGGRINLSGAASLRRPAPQERFLHLEQCHEQARGVIADLEAKGRSARAIEIMLAKLAPVREIAA